MRVNRKDLLIISNLRTNARESLTNLSKKVDMPISTIFDRLRMHEGTLIKRHTSLIDFNQLGYFARAHIVLKVRKDDRDIAREHLNKSLCVNSVYKINNNYDFLVEGIFRNVKELEDFVEDLEERFTTQDIQVYYIIEDIKQEGFMADPRMLDLIMQE
ncbi:hypothetical protein COV94_01645 [Candidatus Woesearchaeota archaeon CG11_big_fil_rev_8_21_14_0_20_57_5]|nr:MAG: hypothetical protein COV94_01645 [Candidatus Woesearchaeota archaeon CG11_big_fil_rev_8_21_14_0_20_57_5]